MTEGLRLAFANWPHQSPGDLLAGADVLVSSASLRGDADEISRALGVLSPTERERFDRYENGDVARRFALGRLRLREMLGALLSLAPGRVPIQIGLHGKPALAWAAQPTGLRFSVAHCEDLLLVALTRLGEVGIDVERVRPIERWARVADRVFNPSERAAMGREIANGDEPSSVFFRFWCRGEAELTEEFYAVVLVHDLIEAIEALLGEESPGDALDNDSGSLDLTRIGALVGVLPPLEVEVLFLGHIYFLALSQNPGATVVVEDRVRRD